MAKSIYLCEKHVRPQGTLAAGGRGGVCAIRGVSNSELTNWNSKRKRMDGVSVNIVFNVLRLSKNIRRYK